MCVWSETAYSFRVNNVIKERQPDNLFFNDLLTTWKTTRYLKSYQRHPEELRIVFLLPLLADFLHSFRLLDDLFSARRWSCDNSKWQTFPKRRCAPVAKQETHFLHTNLTLPTVWFCFVFFKCRQNTPNSHRGVSMATGFARIFFFFFPSKVGGLVVLDCGVLCVRRFWRMKHDMTWKAERRANCLRGRCLTHELDAKFIHCSDHRWAAWRGGRKQRREGNNS